MVKCPWACRHTSNKTGTLGALYSNEYSSPIAGKMITLDQGNSSRTARHFNISNNNSNRKSQRHQCHRWTWCSLQPTNPYLQIPPANSTLPAPTRTVSLHISHQPRLQVPP